MGNTLDMAKIKEDHQARTQRIRDAWHAGEPRGFCAHMADSLMELAAIWREQANHLSELPNPKPRGWKTTMDSLRDCATRVSGVAVAMRQHGLPEGDADPKENLATDVETSTASPAPVAGAAQVNGEQLALVQPLQDGKSELQQDLQRVYNGRMTVNQFREKWPEKIPEGQMLEFLKDRNKFGPVKDDDAGPKDAASVSKATESTPSSAPGNSNARERPRPSDDPVGDFMRDLKDLHKGDWTHPVPRQGLSADFVIIDDPIKSQPESAFMQMDTFKAMIADNKLEEETLAEAASVIIEQVREAKAAVPADLWSSDTAQAAGFSPDSGPVTVTYDATSPTISAGTKEVLEGAAGAFYMNSNGALNTPLPSDDHAMKLVWNEGLNKPTLSLNRVQVLPEGHQVQQIIPGVKPFSATWEIGPADAPPAWSTQPPVPVFELDAHMEFDPPAHTSVSQANQAAECALKRKLVKRHGAPQRPSWALVGGKALHSCIEIIERSHLGSVWSSESVALLWSESFERAQSETINKSPLFPKALWHASNKGKEDEAWWNADGPEMVHHYLIWRAKWMAQGWELLKTADGRSVVELEFLWFARGGMVKGFIDSAWYHPGRNMIAIVDWKSGSSKPADYFQQATYRHALEPLLGETAFTAQVKWLGAFWDARSGELGPAVDLDVRHPRLEVELRLSMPRRLDEAGIYMPNVNTGYGGCGSCSLKRSCPVGSRMGTGEVTL